jgi:signal transduction histidine kinase
VLVALGVAAPVLILGQASEDETRARLRAAQVEAATHTAELTSTSLNDRYTLIRDTLASLALSPRPDASPIGLAVQRGDVATLQAIADTVQRLYPRYVVRAYVAVRGNAATISDAMVVAAAPAGTDLAGRRLSEISGPGGAALRPVLGQGSIGFFGAITESYPGSADVPSLTVIAASIPGNAPGDTQTQRILAPVVIVAEIDDARIFADAAAPLLASGDNAYFLDPHRLLLGRARGKTDFPLLDLSNDPFVQLLGPATTVVARFGAQDPLGAGRRLIASYPLPMALSYGPHLIASYPLPMASSYEILVVRDTTQIDRELDAALSQLAILRLVVVAMLVGLAYLAALAGRQLTLHAVDGERLRLARDLHDLLGHSLSLISIKSQLAGRLLPGDTSAAASEIADVERVARESLQDVRHAVEGYRQPSLAAALVSARAALAAAGIETTIDTTVEKLPADVDATLAWAVREGVTNVIRHSRATICSIRVARDGREAIVDITDNGPVAATIAPGSGLRGLQERAAARGGRVAAGPSPRGGFLVHVSIPL